MNKFFLNFRWDQPTFLLQLIFALLYLVNLGLLTWLIIHNLNLSAFDAAGHIASTHSFTQVGTHSFNDRLFLGSTHNLFYPPLEDIIVNLIQLLSFTEPISAFKIYLILVIWGYFFSLFHLSRSLKKPLFIFIFHVCFLLLFNMDKTYTIHLQGLSVDDFFLIGLTNQFLSAIFFFWLCSEICFPSKKTGPRTALLVVLTSLSILSHIVMGLVAGLLLFATLFFHYPPSRVLRNLSLVLGLTAFFSIPFFVYRNYVTSSNIYTDTPWTAYVLSLIGIYLFRKNKFALPLLLTSFILLTTNTLFPSLVLLRELAPTFHYYRFGIIAYFLLFIGLLAGLNTFHSTDKKIRILVLLLPLIFCAHLIHQFNFKRDYFLWTKIDFNYDFNSIKNFEFETYGRYLSLDHYRAAETALDSLLTLYFPYFRSTKGLFWESHYSNSLQSSYLATHLRPPMVLDYFYYWGQPCHIQACLLEENIRHYNIKGIIGSYQKFSVDDRRRDCFTAIFNKGTYFFTFEKVSDFLFNHQRRDIYRVNYRPEVSQLNHTNMPVELLVIDQLSELTKGRGATSFHAQVMRDTHTHCAEESYHHLRNVFYLPGQQRILNRIIKKASNAHSPEILGLDLVKINENHFKFTLPDTPTLFLLKLAPQPGMKIINKADGKVMPLLKGFPGAISIGQGEMLVKFVKTPIMYLGYFLSLFTFFYIIYEYLGNFRRSRN